MNTLFKIGVLFATAIVVGCAQVTEPTDTRPGRPGTGVQPTDEVIDASVFGVAVVEEIDRLVVSPIDPLKLRETYNARADKAERPGPLRFAEPEQVAVGSDKRGTWEQTPDGRIWRMRIHAPGAVSINLGLNRFSLSRGAALRLRSLDGEEVQGPYTAKDRNHEGGLWTAIIESDEILLELFVPRSGRAAIEIGSVNRGFKTFAKSGAAKAGSCNNDVICPVGDPWRDQIRSVGRYSINGSGLCTGTMVNNTAVDFTPYFLSANHCGVTTSNDHTVVVYWNFESPNCGDLGGGSLADSQSGSTFRASYSTNDMLLIELDAMPNPAHNVFYSGWDANNIAAAMTVGIHHPSADEKAISFNNNAVTSTNYLDDTVNPTANYWRVDDWEDGTTEPGSSGSCIWNASSKRCVGTLHGGYAACPDENERDWYGKFSTDWTGGGTNSTRVSNWLDPINSGVLVLNGDPHVTTLDGTSYDFQGAGEFIALRDGSDAEIQVRQAAISTTFNPGANAYSGLATCVSLNTAIAAQVGKHRVTYQPNLSGVPDPSGLQLRIDGSLQSIGGAGINLSDGGRVERTSAPGGIELQFPDRYTLVVTPGWWSSQEKWYLNVSVAREEAQSFGGASPNGNNRASGGLAGDIPDGSWLPLMPDGSALGPRPTALSDRYDVLYRKFGDAWRVRKSESLFDYAPGTSTDNFTIASWPAMSGNCELPNVVTAKPVSRRVAVEACRGVADPATRADCEFDVEATGEVGFATTYLHSERTMPGRMCKPRHEAHCEDNHGKPNPGWRQNSKPYSRKSTP